MRGGRVINAQSLFTWAMRKLAYKIECNLSENLLRRRILLQIDRSLLIGEQSLTSSLQNLKMMRVSIRREAHTFMESLGYVYAKDIGRQSLA